jgi:hypothetical protein
MLEKSSIFLMLLLGAGSLIGISTIYKPANIETQPQPQQPTQKPPGFVLPPVQQPNSGPITQEQAKTFNQGMADIQLLDRIFPIIIQRIDGKVLAQKIDAATLLQKIDGKLLAEKLLPHIEVRLRFGDNYGPVTKVKKDPLAPDSYAGAEARCPLGSRVMGGGGQIAPYGNNDYNGAIVKDNSIVSMGPIPTQRFVLVGKMDSPGDLSAYATCLGVLADVVVKP